MAIYQFRYLSAEGRITWKSEQHQEKEDEVVFHFAAARRNVSEIAACIAKKETLLKKIVFCCLPNKTDVAL